MQLCKQKVDFNLLNIKCSSVNICKLRNGKMNEINANPMESGIKKLVNDFCIDRTIITRAR